MVTGTPVHTRHVSRPQPRDQEPRSDGLQLPCLRLSLLLSAPETRVQFLIVLDALFSGRIGVVVIFVFASFAHSLGFAISCISVSFRPLHRFCSCCRQLLHRFTCRSSRSFGRRLAQFGSLCELSSCRGSFFFSCRYVCLCFSWDAFFVR